MKRLVVVTFGAALALASGPARPASPPVPGDSNGVPRMSQEDFKKGLAAGKILPVDTRSELAYAAGHVPGALLWNGDPGQLEAQLQRLKAAKKQIVTYCT